MEVVMSKKPVSQAKLAANRANAKHATGPKSAEGKSRSAANAVKHGLLAENHVEGQSHEPSTLAAFTAQFAPATPLEHSLVARLASLDGRLHRITEIETGLFEDKLAQVLGIYPELAADPSRHLGTSYDWASKTLNLLSFYEARLSRDFHRTLAELRRTQELRRAEEEQAAAAALDSEGLDKQTQTPAESSSFDPLPARESPPPQPPPTNTSHPKSENPASFASQPGPVPLQTASTTASN
jgi:hypothetical protein